MNDQQTVQGLLQRIPRGRVTTYKEIAHAMNTRAYRYVGQLLHNNPHPDTYPCYKVVQSDGKLGGFALGQAEKIRRLKADGIQVKNGKVQNWDEVLFHFRG